MRKQNTPKADKVPAVAGPMLTEEIKAAIAERSAILNWMEKGKAREMELRKTLVSVLASKLKEGTNNVQGDGYVAKIGHTISRKLDVAALDSVMPELPEEFRVLGSPDSLIQYKPAFNLETYRAMPAQARKIFEQALTITESESPSLEIILNEAVEFPRALDVNSPTAEAASKPSRVARVASKKPAAVVAKKPAAPVRKVAAKKPALKKPTAKKRR